MANTLHDWSYATPDDRLEAELNAAIVNVSKNKQKDTVVLVREWTDMDPKAADDFVYGSPNSLTLNGGNDRTTFADPKVDKQAYTGTYQALEHNIIQQPDRAVTVQQTLALPITSAGNGSSFKVLWLEDDYTQHDVYYYWDNTIAQYTAASDFWDAGGDIDPGVEVNFGRISFTREGALDFIVETVTRSRVGFGLLKASADTISYATRYGTAYLQSHRNSTTAELTSAIAGSELTSGTNNTVSATKLGTDLWNWTINRRPYVNVQNDASDATYWDGWEIEVVTRVNGRAHDAKIAVEYDGDIGDAEDHIKVTPTSGYELIPGVRGHVTGIRHLNGGVIKEAKRVWQTISPA
jgi:hypothetical protein